MYKNKVPKQQRKTREWRERKNITWTRKNSQSKKCGNLKQLIPTWEKIRHKRLPTYYVQHWRYWRNNVRWYHSPMYHVSEKFLRKKEEIAEDGNGMNGGEENLCSGGGGEGFWEKRRGGDGKARVDILAPWGIHALLHNIAYPPSQSNHLSSIFTPTL